MGDSCGQTMANHGFHQPIIWGLIHHHQVISAYIFQKVSTASCAAKRTYVAMYKHFVEFCSVVDLSIYIYIWYYLLKRNKIEHLDTYRVTLEFLNKCLMMWQKRKTKLSRPILEQWIPHQWQLKGTIWRFKLPPHLTTPLTWYESLNHVTFRI